MRIDTGKALKTGRLNVGLSAIVGLTLSTGAIGSLYLNQGASGTFDIVSGPTLSSTNGWSAGFALGASMLLKIPMSGTVYFTCSGATGTIFFIQTLSDGFEV